MPNFKLTLPNYALDPLALRANGLIQVELLVSIVQEWFLSQPFFIS